MLNAKGFNQNKELHTVVGGEVIVYISGSNSMSDELHSYATVLD